MYARSSTRGVLKAIVVLTGNSENTDATAQSNTIVAIRIKKGNIRREDIK
jgi:hypothetical protein